MPNKRSLPGPITILMVVTIIAAVCTWVLPAGQYNKLSVANGQSFLLVSHTGETHLPLTQKTLDSLQVRIAVQKFINGDIHKPVSIPGTFEKQPRTPQGFLKILQAPIKGIVDSIDIVLFVLMMGGFMYVFNETGAIKKGIVHLSKTMRGREPWLVGILTFLFSFGAASYGMGEEALTFYPLLVPLFLAAGYDLMVPLSVIFGGTMLGGIAAFSSPFSTIIASNAAGINWMDGLYERLFLFAVITGLTIWYNLRYAARVKKDPSTSLVLQIDGHVVPPYDTSIDHESATPKLEHKTQLLLFIFLSTFVVMIVGVVFLGWWTLELSVLYLGSSVLVGFICRMNEKIFVREFVKGAESLLYVAFIVGVARGITIVLNEGHIGDSILYYAANLVQGMPPAIFIVLLMVFYVVISNFIGSSSGLAVLTMPIIGALAIIVNIPGREIVNSYMYGLCLMSFISPSQLVLPSLALVNVSLKAWIKFITPLLIMLTIICVLFLVAGVYIK